MTSSWRDHPSAPTLAAATAMVSVQTGAAFGKGLFPLVGPTGVAALRLGLAALMLCLLMRPWRLWRTTRNWPALLGYGVMLGLMNLTIYRAFQTIPVSIAVSIEVTGPLGVALLSSRQRRDVLWIVLALAGVALLPWGTGGAGLDPAGVAWSVAAAVCWGAYVVFGSRVAADGGQAVATGISIAALFAVPLGIHAAGAALLSPHALATGLAVALLSSLLPFLLDMFAMRHLPRQVFGVLMSASPAMAALAAWAVLGERLSGPQVAGIAAVMAACAGSAWYGRPAAAAADGPAPPPGSVPSP